MRFFLAYIPLIFVMFGISCESNRTFENYVSLKNDEWNISQKPVFYVDVQDTTTEHNIYFNIRHTGNYKYANLFILFTVQGPKSKAETNRFEFKLAEPDGKWLGSGLGDVYSSSIPVMQKIKFPKKGVYSFSIEQNMRDNPLLGVEDVGIRIEKANQQ